MGNDVTLEDFLKMIPSETRDFFLNFLKTADFDVDMCTYDLRDPNYFLLFQRLALIDYMYDNDSGTREILNKYDYKGNSGLFYFIPYKFKNNDSKKKKNDSEYDDIQLEDVFFKKGDAQSRKLFEDSDELFSELYMVYKYDFNYILLTPYYMVYKALYEIYDKNMYYKSITTPTDRNYFHSLLNEYKKYSDAQFDIYNEKRINSFMNKLPIEIVTLLVKASKAYSFLINDKTKSFGDDLDVLSLLVALYVDDNAKPIVEYFEAMGITKEIVSNISLSELQRSVDKQDVNYGMIMTRFSRFLTVKEDKKLTLTKFVKNLANREISGSLEFERRLNKFGVGLEILDDLDTKIASYKEEAEKNRFVKENKELYSVLPLKVTNYLEYLTKFYTVLKRTYSQNIFDSDELFSISLFIVTLLRDNDKRAFFAQKGITVESILNYLGIEKISISNEELDQKELARIYSTFLLNKFNKSTVTVEELINYPIEKANSRSVNKILKDLNYESKDMYKEMTKYFQHKKEKENMQNAQRIFSNMDFFVLRYLESAYLNFYNILNSQLSNYSVDDKVILALVLTSRKVDYYKNGLYYIFNQQTFASNIVSKIDSFLFVDKPFNPNVDFKKMAELFGKYVFGGRNKGKDKKDIKMLDILNNVFNDELNSSVNLKTLLAEYGYRYEDLTDFETLYNKKLQTTMLEKFRANNVDEEYIKVIEAMAQVLRKYSNRVLSSANCCDYASLLYLYYYDNQGVDFLIKRGYTLERLLVYLEITKEDFEKFREYEIDYADISTNFSNYVCYQNNLSKIIHRSLISDYIDSNDYKKLEYELVNLQAYVDPLDKNAKLELFASMDVPELEGLSVEDISEYGIELNQHADFIMDEYSTVTQSYDADSEQYAILNRSVQQIMPQKPVAFRLFRKNNEISSDSKQLILKDLMRQFKNREEEFKRRLVELQFVRQSIAVFLTKANAYLTELLKTKEEFLIEVKERSATYTENDFRVFDDDLKMQMLNDRILYLTNSISSMVQQYQQVVMQMKTHASLLNHLSMANNIRLKTLYTQISLNNGINQEKAAVKDLKELVSLIDMMSQANAQGIQNNISLINGLSNDQGTRQLSSQELLVLQQIIKEYEDEEGKLLLSKKKDDSES